MPRCFAPRARALDESPPVDKPPAPPRPPRRSDPRRPRDTAARPAQPWRSEPPDAQKLLIIIAADADADRLSRALSGAGFTSTKIGSTGGFLRRGNSTLLCGVPAAGVDHVIDLVGQTCPARSELLPLGALPLAGEMPFIAEPVEVRVGGAVVFVLHIERFERV